MTEDPYLRIIKNRNRPGVVLSLGRFVQFPGKKHRTWMPLSRQEYANRQEAQSKIAEIENRYKRPL
jgi:hypothetical protein